MCLPFSKNNPLIGIFREIAMDYIQSHWHRNLKKKRKKGFKNDFLSHVLQIRRLCHLHFKYCKYEWMKVTRLQLWLCKIAILPPRNLLSWILKANFSKVSLYGTKYPSQQWTLFSNMTVAQGLVKVKIQKAFSKITENT